MRRGPLMLGVLLALGLGDVALAQCRGPNCPVPLRRPQGPTKGPVDTRGVRLDGQPDGQGRYRVSRGDETANRFLAAVRGGKGDLRPWVSVIAPTPGERTETRKRLERIEAEARVRDYPVGDWRVSGGVDQGRPSIVVQRWSGTVTGRLPIDAPIEDVEEAVRRAKPDYDPAKDPTGFGLGLEHALIGGLAFGERDRNMIYIIAVGVGIYLLSRGRQTTAPVTYVVTQPPPQASDDAAPRKTK